MFSQVCIISLNILNLIETARVSGILDLKLSDGEITISNEEAKMILYKTLALPVQSVCQ